LSRPWKFLRSIPSHLKFCIRISRIGEPVQYAIGATVDLFNIWTLVLLIIGLATMSKFSKAKSAVIVISLWLVVNLLSLIGPAMQAKRLNQ